MKSRFQTPCGRPPQHPIHFGEINYTPEQINELLAMIPLKAYRSEIGKLSVKPDEEDITVTVEEKPVLKFKDRDTAKGKGYIILRTEKPLAEQMVQENTIYEIRYDFDLNGEKLEVPANCVLDFKGGSFGNGTVVGDETEIKAGPIHIFEDIKIEGKWNNEKVYSDWFSFSTLETDSLLNTIIIQNLMVLSNGNITTELYIASDSIIYVQMKKLKNDGAFIVPSYTNVHINATIQMMATDAGQYFLFLVDNVTNVSITGGHLIGDVETHTGTTGEWGMGIHVNQSRYVNISNIRCSKFWGDGIDVDGEYDNNSEFIVIENVECDYNRRQGISITGCNNGRITNAYLHHTGTIKMTAPAHGLDIETYKHSATGKEHTVTNFIADGVTTYENYYNGISISIAVGVSTEHAKNVKLINSTISEGLHVSGNEVVVDNCSIGRHIEFRACLNSIIRNTRAGTKLLFYNTLKNLTFENCYFFAYDSSATMSDTATNSSKEIDVKFFNCYFEDIKTVNSTALFQNINYANDVNLKFYKCTIIGNETQASLSINYGGYYECFITSHWNMQVQNKSSRNISFIKCFLQARGSEGNTIYFLPQTGEGGYIAIACDVYAKGLTGTINTAHLNRSLLDEGTV